MGTVCPELGFREAARPALSAVLKGGADAFFYKGTNGRWREVLSREELALYDKAAKRVLTQIVGNGLKTAAAAPLDYQSSLTLGRIPPGTAREGARRWNPAKVMRATS